MSELLYEKYQTLGQDELFDIVIHPENYQKQAIPVAEKVIAEKRWEADLQKKLAELRIEQEEKDELFYKEVEEKAAYYKGKVEHAQSGFSFQVRIPDIPKFEAALEERKIEFFREDKNIGVQLDVYPTQTYYFNGEDTEAVDEICIVLGLITAPYADAKPFFGFEMKVVIVVILLSVLMVFIFG